MIRLQVFDPPMCCSTGICGPSVDPALTRFSADLDWLSRQDVAVERFSLAQDPGAFATDPVVKEELAKGGTAVLPLLLLNHKVVSKGTYPSREELASAVGMQVGTSAKPAGLQVVNSGCCGSGCC